jgi:type IV pilus assembly protein PilY1
MAGALAIGAAQGDDIDVFAGGPAATSKPNVLIILDNSSNWNATLSANSCNALLTKFAAETCALSTVAMGLNDRIRMGLMMYAESGNNGAYVRYAVRDMNTQNKTAFASLVNNFVDNGNGTDNSGSNQPYGKAMFEAFKYFGGYTTTANANNDVAGGPADSTHFGPIAYAGGASNNSGTYRRDYLGNNSGGVNSPTGNRSATKNGADNNTAFADASSNVYISPISDGCAKNFIIFIGNGNPSTGGDASPTDATTLLSNVGGNTSQILSGGTAIHANTADEWARFLNGTDVNSLPGQQKIITYTIGVYAPQNINPDGSQVISNTDQAMIKLLQSMASQGGGKYYAATDAAQVLQAILDILNEVQAVNSVFVSASLPVSVNTQGTFLNQVYMGMFRPDGSGSPRWLGNLKQYKINQAADGSLFLADTANAQAINPSTGFVSPNAKSFWTSDSAFWANNPSGTTPSKSDLPDGEVVEKGGAAEQIRNAYATKQDDRRIYTCPTAGCGTGALNYEFNATNISGAAAQAAFGAASAAELADLVNWVRGTDNLNGTPCDPSVAPCTWTSGEKGPGWKTTIRPSIHGDVLHSRPVVLNYKDSGPWIFYGANDGTLRGTKGGRAATDGAESWAFVAPEFFGKFKRLKTEKPELLTPATPAGIIPAPQKKDYFFDGSIGSYQSPDLATEYIFVTARRGGNVIYAFDVSTPDKPVFMWKKSAADLPEAPLGQTWSEPKAFTVRGVADPIVMFGAGYDPAYDSTPTGAKTMGAGIYVLNAKTGALVKFFKNSQNSAAINAAVPSDIAAIDRDFDTFADRAYVGDMEGNVWRMDIDDANPANWKLFQLASLGARKFFFRPDVVVSKNFDLVLIGSGNREDPLNIVSSDRFYMLKDMFVGKDATGMVPIVTADLVTGGSASAALDAAKGWYVALANGEKVVNAPLSIAGIVFFSTNKPTPPAPGVCAPNLGEARAYAIDFLTGGAGVDRNGDGTKDSTDISIKLTGGGLPPSPVGGVVQLDDGRLVDFVIGSGAGGSPLSPEKPPRTIPKVRRKLYWNTNTDK